jgi:hypothetical protein
MGSIDATTLGVIDALVHRGDKDSVRRPKHLACFL